MRDFQPNSVLKKLMSRLSRRSAVIGVVGLGYVGLPLSLRFVEAGFKVLGIFGFPVEKAFDTITIARKP